MVLCFQHRIQLGIGAFHTAAPDIHLGTFCGLREKAHGALPPAADVPRSSIFCVPSGPTP